MTVDLTILPVDSHCYISIKIICDEVMGLLNHNTIVLTNPKKDGANAVSRRSACGDLVDAQSCMYINQCCIFWRMQVMNSQALLMRGNRLHLLWSVLFLQSIQSTSLSCAWSSIPRQCWSLQYAHLSTFHDPLSANTTK